MFILVVCIILLVLAVALTFYSSTYGTAVAFLALCTSGLMPGVHLGASTYMFWGVAMLIVIALNFILPQGVTASRLGVPYIFTASLAGMLIGLTVSHAAMIVGSTRRGGLRTHTQGASTGLSHSQILELSVCQRSSRGHIVQHHRHHNPHTHKRILNTRGAIIMPLPACSRCNVSRGGVVIMSCPRALKLC